MTRFRHYSAHETGETTIALSEECGLTPRSTGAPTAGHQARAGGTRYIFTGPGLASCRWSPVNSNVRRPRATLWAREARANSGRNITGSGRLESYQLRGPQA